MVVGVVGQASGIAEVAVAGLARFDRVGQVLERRQELEAAETRQRICGRVVLVGVGEGDQLLEDRRRGRVGGKRSDRRRVVGIDPHRLQRAAQQQLVAERGIARIVEVQPREHVGRNDVGAVALVVVGVVDPAGQGQPVGNLEIDLAEDRIGFVVEPVVFGEALPGGEKSVGVFGGVALERAEGLFQNGHAQRPAARPLDQQVGIGPKLGSIRDRIELFDLFVEIKPTEKEVERAIEVACQAQFLGEGIELDGLKVVADQVGAGKVRILPVDRLDLAVRGDRGQLERAGGVICLARNPVVGDVVGRRRVVVNHVGERRPEVVDLAAQRFEQRRRTRTLEVDRGAADFLDLRIIRDHPKLEFIARLEQQLAAHEPAIAIVDLAAGRAEIADIAIAPIVTTRDAGGDRVAERAGQHALDHHGVVVAIARLDISTELELGFAGDDRDHARAGVLAEQRRLRPAQHFDTLDIGQIADLRGRAAAIDAIDEHAHAGLDAGVVGAVAEAADDEIGVGRRCLLVDAQRGDDARQVLEVADLGALDRLGGGHADRDRDRLQGLLALGRGDDDVVALIARLGSVGRRGSLLLRSSSGVLRQRHPGQREHRRQARAERESKATGGAGGFDRHVCAFPHPALATAPVMCSALGNPAAADNIIFRNCEHAQRLGKSRDCARGPAAQIPQQRARLAGIGEPG